MTAVIRSLLLIDDDEVDRKAVRRALDAADDPFELLEVVDAASGLSIAAERPVDCILVDYRLPDMDGLELLARLKSMPLVRCPVIMLTGEGSELVAVEAMKHGADDYLPKTTLSAATLLRALRDAAEKSALRQQLAESQRQFEHLALHDGLTGLGNRNLFCRELRRALSRVVRRRQKLCVVVFDLDGFKAVNDTYGHAAGDAVLSEMGRRLAEWTRAEDAFFRLGGDEFAGIVEFSDGADDEALAALRGRLREILGAPVAYQHRHVQVGASVGVALFPDQASDPQTLVRIADEDMYRAKRVRGGDAGVGTRP